MKLFFSAENWHFNEIKAQYMNHIIMERKKWNKLNILVVGCCMESLSVYYHMPKYQIKQQCRISIEVCVHEYM